jgi:hypothetical protein
MSNSGPDLSSRDVTQYLACRLAFAHRDARMVDDFLTRAGLKCSPRRPASIHPQVALELWGILQIAQWEAAGLRILMNTDLPAAADAFASLRRRLVEEPEQYLGGSSGAALIDRVTETWLRCCEISAVEHLGADVVVNGRSHDSVVNAFAAFLWANRNLITRQGTGHDQRSPDARRGISTPQR